MWKVLAFLLVCATLAQAKKCVEPNPRYCARNKQLCHKAGFIKMMKDVCPITCGYCKPKDNEEKSPADLIIDLVHNEVVDIGQNGFSECREEERACMQSASSHLDKLKCVFNFAKCVGGPIAQCAVKCVPQVFECFKSGSVIEKLRCYMDFVKCLTSCKEEISPVDMLFDYVHGEVDESANGFAECREAEKACMKDAWLGSDQVKCLVNFAKCVGGPFAKCALDCGPKAVKCFQASGIFSKMMCFMNAVTCFRNCKITESSESEAIVEVVAISAIDQFHRNFPAVESFSDCIKAEQDCMTASSGLAKLKCLLDMATCVGSETAQCAQKCGLPLVTCVKSAIFDGSYTDVPACFKTFIHCSVDCAKQSDLKKLSAGPVEECDAERKICEDSGSGIFHKLKCLISFGTCLTTRLGECGLPCVSPFVKCATDHILDPVAALHCYTDLMACVVEKCHKFDLDAESKFETSITEFQETFTGVDSFADCIKAQKDCMKASSGLAKLKCFIDMATCVGSETAACAQKCGLPLVTCVKGAVFGGNFSAVPACFTTFLHCVPSCAQQNDADVLQDFRNAVISQSPNGPVEECTASEKICMDAAAGIFDKLKCVYELGKCLATGIKACGQPCVGPLVSCVTTHILDPVGALKCYTNLAACLVEKCHTPEEISALMVEMNEVVLSQDNSFNDCSVAGDKCMSESTSIIHQLKCVMIMSVCELREVAKCAHKCEKPAIACIFKAAAGGHLSDLPQCFSAFMECARDCAGETEMEFYEAAMENAHLGVIDNGIIDDIKACQAAARQCMVDARGAIGKAKCFIQFGGCLVTHLSGCAMKCVPNFATCMMGAAGNVMEMAKCAFAMVNCVKTECNSLESVPVVPMEFYELELQTGEIDNGIIEDIKACQAAARQCMIDARGAIGKAKCFVQFGGCLVQHLSGCAMKCVPNFATCMMGAAGNPMEMAKCAFAMVNCVKTECNDFLRVEGDGYEPFALAVQTATIGEVDNGVIDIIKQCQGAEEECKNSAQSPIEKAKCFLKFGVCVAKGVAGCAKQCLPNMAFCMMSAKGDPMATFQCAMDFVACAKSKCNAEEEVTAVSNDDIIEKMKQCKEANDKCMVGASSIKDKATCYMSYGLCIGKDLAKCAGPCVPQSAWCMMGARGSWGKMLACGVQFVNCARKECLKDDLRQLA